MYSGSVVRFRSACCGRPTLRTCQLCARSKRRNGSPSVTRRVAESSRYRSDQVQGRHPYLVTRASCCGVPFAPTSRKIKVSEATTSAGILWVLRRRKPTPAYSPIAQSVSRLPGTGGRPPYCRPVPFGTCALIPQCSASCCCHSCTQQHRTQTARNIEPLAGASGDGRTVSTRHSRGAPRARCRGRSQRQRARGARDGAAGRRSQQRQ